MPSIKKSVANINEVDQKENNQTIPPHLLDTTWLNLSEASYNAFLTATSVAEEYTCVANQTPIAFGEDNTRSSILLDFLYHILRYCRSSLFSYFQASTAISIAQNIFLKCVIQDSNCPYDDAINMFKAEIHKICTEDNKFIFSIEVIKSFTIFFSKLFFRNYKLYQTVFQTLQEEVFLERLVMIQAPLRPLPLMEGLLQS